MGMVMAQTGNLTMSAVSVQQAGEASGVNNTLRQIGSSFGSAIIGAVLLTVTASHLSSGVQKSMVIPPNIKPQVGVAIVKQASNVELGGVGDDGQADNLPNNIKNELTRIVQAASSKGSSQAILYTGMFTVAAFGASIFLPNVRDLEARGRKNEEKQLQSSKN
jgi:hypothetical protein